MCTAEKLDLECIEANSAQISDEKVEYAAKSGNRALKKVFGSPHFNDIFDDLQAMVSMLDDYRKKNYLKIPWRTISTSAFAVLYILNPMDLIPDVIFGVGLLDDATVVGISLKCLRRDLMSYKTWKKTVLEIQEKYSLRSFFSCT